MTNIRIFFISRSELEYFRPFKLRVSSETCSVICHERTNQCDGTSIQRKFQLPPFSGKSATVSCQSLTRRQSQMKSIQMSLLNLSDNWKLARDHIAVRKEKKKVVHQRKEEIAQNIVFSQILRVYKRYSILRHSFLGRTSGFVRLPRLCTEDLPFSGGNGRL